MGKNGAILGTIVGLNVLGAKILFEFLSHESTSALSFSTVFITEPFLWIIFSLPFGAILGLIVGIILHLTGVGASPFIFRAIFGGISGYFFTLLLLFIFFVVGAVLGTRLWVVFILYMGLFDLFIPGAIIGAIVGVFLTPLKKA